MADFKGVHFPKSFILYAVFSYVRYSISYRDLQEKCLKAAQRLTMQH